HFALSNVIPVLRFSFLLNLNARETYLNDIAHCSCLRPNSVQMKTQRLKVYQLVKRLAQKLNRKRGFLLMGVVALIILGRLHWHRRLITSPEHWQRQNGIQREWPMG